MRFCQRAGGILRSTAEITITASALLHVLFYPGTGWAQVESIRYPFSLVRLPALGGDSGSVVASNLRGRFVGAAYLGGNHEQHATLWDRRGAHDLGTLGGRWSEAVAINSRDWTVGWSCREPNKDRTQHYPVLWREGRMIALGTLGDDYGEATAINESGQIVGVSYSPGSRYHAILWDRGRALRLPSLSDQSDQPLAINSAGVIVGQAVSTTYGAWRPVRWDESGVHDLGTLQSNNTGHGWASDINEAGYVVGNATGERYSSRAFIWHEGEMRDLDPGGDRDMVALSINNHNEVIGQSWPESFYWSEQHGVRWLSDLTPPQSEWIQIWARDINDASEISASARRGNYGIGTAFCLFPVHPTIELRRAFPGVAGRSNAFITSGVTPGATVVFYYGLHGGGTFIAGCSPRLNTLQIDDPQLLGTAIADEDGRAVITRYVPPSLQGQTVLIQAVVRGECAISELVVQRLD